MRKFGLVVFSLLFFVSLLIFAFSTSSNIAFTHPDKMKHWLNQSNLYGAFVENAIEQAERTAGTDSSGGVSLSDAVVKQAAQSTFSADQLQNDINTFLDSNYAWLEGKSDKPSFSINLTDAKQKFADRVGQYVATYLSGLQICNDAQLAQINPQTADPLTLSCRPANVDPAAEGQAVADQIATSTQFLNDPVITAQTINPDGSTQAQPYYEKLSSLPTVYQLNTKVPWVAGTLIILSGLAIFALALTRRKAFKLISIMMAVAGLVLVLTKLTSDQAFDKLEKVIFNADRVGQLQKALTSFFGLMQDQLVKVDLWFGIAYLGIALVIIVALLASREKGLRPILANGALSTPKTPAKATAQPKAANRPAAPSPRPAKPATKKPRPPRPPRLIQ